MIKEKNIKIDKELWTELSQEKLNGGFKSISDIIKMAWKEFKLKKVKGGIKK